MIRSHSHADVTVLRIDRPGQRNALDTEHAAALAQAVRDAVTDGARCLVITGEGSAFCAGADLNQVYGEDFMDALYGLLHTVTATRVPVVAAVNGPAIGAGTQLAIACDLRVAAPAAAFGIPTARLGLAVDPWTIRRLAALAGHGAAGSLLLGCDTLTAEQAYARGLVDRLGDLDAAMEWAASIAKLAPLTLAYNKAVLNPPPDQELSDPRLDEAFRACWTSEDAKEARQARLERRSPRFHGR